jgi:hypothetical protein
VADHTEPHRVSPQASPSLTKRWISTVGSLGQALAASTDAQVWYNVQGVLGWVMRGNTPDAPSHSHLLEQSNCCQFLTRTKDDHQEPHQGCGERSITRNGQGMKLLTSSWAPRLEITAGRKCAIHGYFDATASPRVSGFKGSITKNKVMIRRKHI